MSVLASSHALVIQPIHGISYLRAQNQPIAFSPYQIGTIEFPINNLIQTEVVSVISNGDGSDTVTYRSLSDFAVTTREFVRVKVTQSP